jgi:hypothetical protein
VFSQVEADGNVGQDIDFANSRPARSLVLNTSATIRPTNHFEVALVANQQWLSVAPTGGNWQRLFAAHVSRVKSTYTFTSKMFVRAIAQYVSTDRDPSLYTFDVPARSGDFGGSLLFAYKINWQSVMFVGYGDDRELTPLTLDRPRHLAALDRQVFVKLSYALQR